MDYIQFYAVNTVMTPATPSFLSSSNRPNYIRDISIDSQ
jgi:hypothetical protein